MAEQVAVPTHLLPLLRAVEQQCRAASTAYARGMTDTLIILARELSVQTQPEEQTNGDQSKP